MTRKELSLRRKERRGCVAHWPRELPGLDVRAIDKWHQAVNNRRVVLLGRRDGKRGRRLGYWWRQERHWSLRMTRPTAVPIMQFV
ncbi:MAG: hypothetical protein KGL39_28800 [Patescibacteria group bacterium]|nr:hypothetical protein [Patescibacteria group bacterium]